MHFISKLSALGAAAAMIMLAGCSGGASSAVAPGTDMHPHAPRDSGLVFRSDNDPDAATQFAFVGQQSSTGILEYKLPNSKNHVPVCFISPVSVPHGIGVQPGTRNLYVTEGGSNTISVHRPNCGAAVGTPLADPNGQPGDVAFNATTGTIYVPNILNNGSAAGTIQVYKKTDHSPSSQLSNSSMFFLLGIDTDKAGNVWQTYLKPGTFAAGLIEFIGGKMPGHVHHITGPRRPGGVEFDQAQNMIIIDNFATSARAYIYKPPYTGAAFKTFTLKNTSIFGKLDLVNKNLYVSDSGNGTIDVYKYPSGKYEYSISNGLNAGFNVEGIAIDLPE